MRISRRSFLTTAAALAGAAATGREVLARAHRRRKHRRPRPIGSRVAVVGAGGRGADNIRDVVTDGRADRRALRLRRAERGRVVREYPDARKYTGLAPHAGAEKTIDAVLVATPDHNHAIVSVAAMRLGKHVYCEKPLAHSIWEVRQMAKVAAETTRRDADGHAGPRVRGHPTRGRGDPRRARSATSRSCTSGPTGRPAGGRRACRGRPTRRRCLTALDWDVWLGPAPERPYNPAYVPFKWRGFWDFGTGAIGDMGIHNLDTAFWGLELGTPTRVEVRECSPA